MPASELTGWELNIMTEEAANAKGESEAANAIQAFIDQLGVDEDVAHVLVREGFTSLDGSRCMVPKPELMAVPPTRRGSDR